MVEPTNTFLKQGARIGDEDFAKAQWDGGKFGYYRPSV